MTASLLLFVPIALLVLISGFCFVGCAFDSHGTGVDPNKPDPDPKPVPFTKYSDDDVIGNSSAVAYWRLNEAAATATKPVISAIAKDFVGSNDGNYTDAVNAPDLFPCPGFPIAPGVDTAAALGTLTLGAESIVPGDAEPDLQTGMQTDGAFVAVPLNAVVNPPPPFTVECWVRREWSDSAGAAFRMVIDSRDATGGAFTGFCIDVNEDGNWEAELGTVGATAFVVVTAGPAVQMTATHVVLTVDATNTATLFINGDSTAPKSLGAAFAANKTQPLIIGAGLHWLPLRSMGGPDASFPLVPFKGTIQDVAIYDDVLDPGTISKHSNDGSGKTTVPAG
jgi:hypothetical protein